MSNSECRKVISLPISKHLNIAAICGLILLPGVRSVIANQAAEAPDAKKSMQMGLDWLLKNQNADGSWGSHKNPLLGGFDEFFVNPETQRSWTVATTSLGCMAMFDAPRSEATIKAYEKGIEYVLQNALVKRSSEWDTDNVWAYVYSLPALARAYNHPTAGLVEKKQRVLEITQGVLDKMKESQTPHGGWGYYDFEVHAHPGAWATSFTTAVGVLGMLDVKEAGVAVDDRMLKAAITALKRCRLPSGAYTYSVNATPSPGSLEWIDQIKGSLGRIQVCNLALLRGGENITLDDLRTGLDHFFKEHKFLDIAYQKPIPHETYYLNSGYFYFFGHYYASQVIERLPEKDRATYTPLLQHEIIKRQEKDGSMWDFHMNSYGRPYGVAFSVLGLSRTIPPVDVKPPDASEKALENR